MKPVYFPFTFISRPVIEAVSACFRQIVVYQPSERHVPEQMRQWAESGMLEIRIPVKEDEERLEADLSSGRMKQVKYSFPANEIKSRNSND